MYLYETHLHTAPLSACAKAEIPETLEYYKSLGYAGVFLTNHFLDGNIEHSVRELPYEERIEHFFASQDIAVRLGEELGISVFSCCEMSYRGTDFLVYGLDREWCLSHKDMDKMKKTELLTLLISDGILVIQAHPFHEARYIDHIRLYPRQIHGVEVFNASMTELKNKLAEDYCRAYNLIPFAGSDNHTASEKQILGGMATEAPIASVQDFVSAVLSGVAKPFKIQDGAVELLNF